MTLSTWVWNYSINDARILNLFDKSASDQWQSATDLDWGATVDPARVSCAIGGAMVSPGLVARVSESQRNALLAGMGSLTFSQLLHGEQGALLVSANLVRLLPSVDMKQAAASQANDEARHLAVFSRYAERLGEIHPPSASLRRVLEVIVAQPLWLAQLVGMQIVVEGMALATFLDMRSNTECLLLRSMLDLVIRDEARHVAFGKIALRHHLDLLDGDDRAALRSFTLQLVQMFRNWGSEPEDMINNAHVMAKAGIDPIDMIVAVQMNTLAGHSLDLSRGMRFAFFGFILPNLEQLGLISAEDLRAIQATMPTPGEDLAALDRLRTDLVR